MLLATGHIRAELVEAVPATHTTNGTAAYYYCADCDAKFEGRAPEAAELTDEEIVLLATGHIRAELVEAVPATHTTNGTAAYYYCAECDAKFEGRAPEAAELTDEEIVLLATGHIRAELVEAVPATHTTNGTAAYYYCAECDAKYESRDPQAAELTDEEIVLLATGHIRAELVEAVPATCTANGTAAYYYCAECDAKYESRDPQAAELTDEEIVLLATGHIRAELIAAKDATYAEDGNIAYYLCPVCGGKYEGRAPEAKQYTDEEVILPMLTQITLTNGTTTEYALAAGVTYSVFMDGFETASMMDMPNAILSWIGDATVTVNGSAVTSPATIEGYSPRMCVIEVTLETAGTVSFTVEQAAVEVPTLELGEHSIEVDGEYVATFTAPAAGDYYFYTAEGEANAYININDWEAIIEVSGAAKVTLTEGQTINVAISTYDWSVDTIDFEITDTMKSETVQLAVGENSVAMAPYIQYYIQVTEGYTAETPTLEISWTENASVIYNGNAVTGSIAIDSYVPRRNTIIATVEEAATVTITVVDNTPAAPELVLGENGIEADGEVIATFTAPADGDYYFYTAEGEANAYININDWEAIIEGSGKEMVTLTAGQTINVAISTYDWSVDTIDFVISDTDPDAIQKFDFAGTNMTLGNDLALNFYIQKADLNGTTGNYAVVTMYKADGTTKQVTISQDEFQYYGTSTSIFGPCFNGIAAKEMSDNIICVIYNAEGVAISNERSESVRSYAMKMMSSSQPDKQKTMAVDMLNYGAAAQTYFVYNTADLANNQLTEAHQALATADVEVENNQKTDAAYAGANLNLESKIELTLFFESSVVTSNTYAVISYTSHTGTEVNKRVESSTYSNTFGASYNGVVLDTMVVADCSTDVTVTVYDAATDAVISTAVDSVASYAARATGTLADLCKAIMKFSVGAYNSFH